MVKVCSFHHAGPLFYDGESVMIISWLEQYMRPSQSEICSEYSHICPLTCNVFNMVRNLCIQQVLAPNYPLLVLSELCSPFYDQDNVFVAVALKNFSCVARSFYCNKESGRWKNLVAKWSLRGWHSSAGLWYIRYTIVIKCIRKNIYIFYGCCKNLALRDQHCLAGFLCNLWKLTLSAERAGGCGEHKVYKTPQIIFLPIVWQYTGENFLALAIYFWQYFRWYIC